MELTKCKLGELITQRREKNDGSDLPICGVSKDGLIPPKELLDSFDKISTQLTELIYQNEADIDVCHKLSDTLLQRLTLQD